MSIKRYFLFVFAIVPIIGTNESTYLFPYLHTQSLYDLKTEEAITRYLPQRLHNLVTYAHTHDRAATIEFITQDPDLDSYLFMFQAENQQKLMAYSRHPEWANKTPAALQKIFFSENNSKISIARSVSEIVHTAYRSTSYVSYQWAPDGTNEKRQIAYVALITLDDTVYVLGTARYITRQYEHIILPYNTNALINRVQKDGLDVVIDLINNHNPDPERYYYIAHVKYPYRYVAYGNTPSRLNMSPKERREQDDPLGKDETINYEKHVKDLIAIAQKGGGFYAYIVHDKNDVSKKKVRIAYVKMFTYQKKIYIMVRGYVPALPSEIVTRIEQDVINTSKLFEEAGLKNTVSALKKFNTDERYIYITDTTPPYKYLLHQNPHFDKQPIPEVQKYLNLHDAKFNLSAIITNNAAIAKRGGGWTAYTFIVDPQNPEKGYALKVGFIKPFRHNNTLYYFANGIGLENVS